MEDTTIGAKAPMSEKDKDELNCSTEIQGVLLKYGCEIVTKLIITKSSVTPEMPSSKPPKVKKVKK